MVVCTPMGKAHFSVYKHASVLVILSTQILRGNLSGPIIEKAFIQFVT